MPRTDVFVKVELEHERDENVERIGDEICRQIARMYGVRTAEVTNFTTVEE